MLFRFVATFLADDLDYAQKENYVGKRDKGANNSDNAFLNSQLNRRSIHGKDTVPKNYCVGKNGGKQAIKKQSPSCFFRKKKRQENMVNRRRNYAYYKNYKKLYPVVTYVSSKIRKVGGGEKGKQVGDEKKQYDGQNYAGKGAHKQKGITTKAKDNGVKNKNNRFNRLF